MSVLKKPFRVVRSGSPEGVQCRGRRKFEEIPDREISRPSIKDSAKNRVKTSSDYRR
jgi:hypothetical protein